MLSINLRRTVLTFGVSFLLIMCGASSSFALGIEDGLKHPSEESPSLPTPTATSTSTHLAKCYSSSCRAVSQAQVAYAPSNKPDWAPTECTFTNPETKKEEIIPCTWPLQSGSWWSKADQCYYWYTFDATDSVSNAKPGEYGYYGYHCMDPDKYNELIGTPWGLKKWSLLMVPLKNAETMPPSHPILLAVKASKDLKIPTPSVTHRYQGHDEYGRNMVFVNASMWWWGDAKQWAPMSATAKALKSWTTVTATPIGWTFDPGNGQQPVGCANVGTVWQNGDGAWKPSPSGCSYRYPFTSGRQPNLTFTATFTMNWAITWQSSDGSTGTLPNMSNHYTTAFPVGEAQTVVTR